MLKQATLYWCIFRCFVQHFIGDKEGAEQRADHESWVKQATVRMLKQATLYWCIFRCFVQHFIGDKEGAEQRADHEWL